jgi:dipeptidase E
MYNILNIISFIIILYWIYSNYYYILEYFINKSFYYSNIKLDRSNNKNLLLLSNSSIDILGNRNHLEHASSLIKTFIENNKIKEILFITYAYPNIRDNKNTKNADIFYINNVKPFFNKFGVNSKLLNTNSSPSNQQNEIRNAKAIYMSGGNTFMLTYNLHKNGVIPILREKILNGLPYIGVSAGTNIISPTMQTSNDMPVVCLTSCETLNIIPFQINVHYNTFKEGKGFTGETRDKRIQEYLEYNTKQHKNENLQNYVLGLKEGTGIHISGNKIELVGFKTRPASLFTINNNEIIEKNISIGDRIDYLLNNNIE